MRASGPRGYNGARIDQEKRAAMTEKFDAGSLIIRILMALLLVFVTYNPSGYSYYHWLRETAIDRNFGDLGPWIALAGISLVIIWVIFLRATLRSFGVIGLVLAFAFCGSLLWLVISLGVVPTDKVEPITYVILVLFSGILGVGMSWSHIRRRLTGQLDVDDVDVD